MKKLLAQNYSLFLPAFSSTGCRDLSEYLLGHESLADAIKSWKFREHEYARRQLTWFKKMKDIHWFDPTESDYFSKIEELVRIWYTSERNAHKDRNII